MKTWGDVNSRYNLTKSGRRQISIISFTFKDHSRARRVWRMNVYKFLKKLKRTFFINNLTIVYVVRVVTLVQSYFNQ